MFEIGFQQERQRLSSKPCGIQTQETKNTESWRLRNAKVQDLRLKLREDLRMDTGLSGGPCSSYILVPILPSASVSMSVSVSACVGVGVRVPRKFQFEPLATFSRSSSPTIFPLNRSKRYMSSDHNCQGEEKGSFNKMC